VNTNDRIDCRLLAIDKPVVLVSCTVVRMNANEAAAIPVETFQLHFRLLHGGAQPINIWAWTIEMLSKKFEAFTMQSSFCQPCAFDWFIYD
jgi:hypothetical protein